MTRSVFIALILAAAAPAFAAAPNRFAATAVAAERFESGVLLVERHGQRGRPLILIPGLAGGSWVWQDAIAQFKDEHVVYVLTLPGFDGRAAVPGNMLKAAQQSLHDLIVSRKLAEPVLVGHSLGGSLALAIAQQDPELVGGVATIEGLPVFPGTEDIPIDQRAQMAEGIRQRMGAIKPDAFAAQQRQYMRSAGVVDMARADELAKLSANSDPAASVRYMGEAMALDLRPGLPAIKAPVLVLAPFFDTDAAQTGGTAASKIDYYKSLMAGTPKVEVVAIPDARHFAMFDQPRHVSDALRAFLKAFDSGH